MRLVVASLALVGVTDRASATPSLHISVAPAQPTVGAGIWFSFGITDLPGTTAVQRWENTRNSFFLFSVDGALTGETDGNAPGTFPTNGCSESSYRSDADCIAMVGRIVGPFQLDLGHHTAGLSIYRSAVSDLGPEGLDPIEIPFDVLPNVNLGGGGKTGEPFDLDLPFVDLGTLPTGKVLLITEDGTATAVDIATLATRRPNGDLAFSLPFGVADGTTVSYAGDANNTPFSFTVGVPAPAAPFVLALAALALARRKPRRRA